MYVPHPLDTHITITTQAKQPQKAFQHKSLKLELPGFSGEGNIIAWLKQVEQVLLLIVM